MNTIVNTVEHAEPLTGHVAELVATPAPVNLLAIIRDVAMNPEADIDKMERLMVMHEKMINKESAREYNQAMAECQAALPVIYRDMDNKQTSSGYASYENITRAIRPIYTSFGLSLSFNTPARTEDTPDDCTVVTCRVSHKAGHSEDFIAQVPTDSAGIRGTVNKTKTHAYGSSVSYGERYLVDMIFNLAYTHSDDDGNAAYPDEPALIPEKPPFPDERFNEMFPTWDRKIQEGKSSVDHVLSMTAAIGPMSTEQLAKLNSIQAGNAQ